MGKLRTINAQYFESGLSSTVVRDAAISMRMDDDYYLIGWTLDINIPYPIDDSAFICAELSLEGKFKAEFGLSSGESQSQKGATLDVVTTEVNFHKPGTSGESAVRTDAHNHVMLPREAWVPLNEGDYVYMNAKFDKAANLRVVLYLLER